MSARLGSLSVQGLRCLDGFDVLLSPLTALIGANGAGKSSTVRAIEFMFGHTDLDSDDLTDGFAGDITVTATIVDLPPAWTTELSAWLSDSKTLTISRVRSVGEDGRVAVPWITHRVAVAGFGEFRSAVAQGMPVAELKPTYTRLRQTYPALPAWSSKVQVSQALDEFEAANPDAEKESVADDMLTFKRGGRLDGLIELLVLPALRDASEDATEHRGSTLSRLVELTVRAGLNIEDPLRELSEKTEAEYDRILTEQAGTTLTDLADAITVQLNSFAPGARVSLTWDRRPMTMTAPAVSARLVESGHEAEIGRQGHGVQRAYVFSLLRALLSARRASAPEHAPGLVLIVEEPEVYQHPVRARYVAKVLDQLAADPQQGTQVIFTTHSPYFVSIANVDSVRLLRLCEMTEVSTRVLATSPRFTRAFSFDAQQASVELNVAQDGGGRPWTAERVRSQLPSLLSSSLAEGLFADAALLVEGAEDVGLIEGAAAATGVDLAGAGVALVGVAGKAQLPLAWVVLRSLGIPTYLVFDTDDHKGKKNDDSALFSNKTLTALAGNGTGERQPGARMEPTWATGHPSLRDAVATEIGEDAMNAAYRQTAEELGVRLSDTKNGYHAQTAIVRLYEQGRSSATLEGIIAAANATTQL